MNTQANKRFVFCVTTDVYFPRDLTPELAWHRFTQSLVKFPRPNKIDRFVHNDGDRKSGY